MIKGDEEMIVRYFLAHPLDPGRERSLQVPIRDPSADCRTAKDDVNARKLQCAMLLLKKQPYAILNWLLAALS